MLRLRLFAMFAGVFVLLPTACVAPARSFSAYESKAVDSAESATSNAETAILTVGLATGGRLESPTTSLILQDAAIGAATAVETFASIQPPDAASDSLRRELLPELQAAADTVALMRIAARRVDAATLSSLITQLRPIADRLERFAVEHR
jgi:hypothetical protein